MKRGKETSFFFPSPTFKNQNIGHNYTHLPFFPTVSRGKCVLSSDLQANVWTLTDKVGTAWHMLQRHKVCVYFFLIISCACTSYLVTYITSYLRTGTIFFLYNLYGI